MLRPALLCRYQEVYTTTVGYELQHVTSPEELAWLRSKVETAAPSAFDKDEKARVLNRLAWASQFEYVLLPIPQ